MEENNWLDMLDRNTQIAQILETNQYAKKYGLVLSQEDTKLLVTDRERVLKEERRVEFGGSILPKLIYAFCDSAYITQDHYCDSLMRLQQIFYLYKNEMMDAMSDDELIEIMREQFEEVCYGDFDYLEGTCLEIFAQAVRAGYRGYISSQGKGEKGNISFRWDREAFLEVLYSDI